MAVWMPCTVSAFAAGSYVTAWQGGGQVRGNLSRQVEINLKFLVRKLLNVVQEQSSQKMKNMHIRTFLFFTSKRKARRNFTADNCSVTSARVHVTLLYSALDDMANIRTFIISFTVSFTTAIFQIFPLQGRACPACLIPTYFTLAIRPPFTFFWTRPC